MKAKIIIVIVVLIIGASILIYKFASPSNQMQTVPSSSQKQVVGKSEVTIANFAFSPETLAVKAGQSVTWANQDQAAHSATADDSSFDTGLLNTGQSKSITFSKSGTYNYHCSVHPMMVGKIIVQ